MENLILIHRIFYDMDKAVEGFKIDFIFITIVFLSIGMYMQGKINNIDRVYSLHNNALRVLLSFGIAMAIERFAAYVTHSLILTPFIIPVEIYSNIYWHHKLFNRSDE